MLFVAFVLGCGGAEAPEAVVELAPAQPEPATEGGSLVIVHSGRVDGDIEPCG